MVPEYSIRQGCARTWTTASMEDDRDHGVGMGILEVLRADAYKHRNAGVRPVIRTVENDMT